MIKNIASIVFFTMLLVACKEKKDSNASKPKEPNASNAKDAKELVERSANLNKGYGTYSITAPEGWEKEEKKKDNVRTTIIFSPLENKRDNFRDNVNVITEKVPAGLSLEAYMDVSLQNISKYLTNFVENNRSETTINGLPAKVIDYNHSMQGYTFDVMVYLLLKNDIAYIITCSTKKGDMEKYRSEFQNIANSFTIN